MNRFMIAAGGLSPQQQDVITKWLQGHDWQFWHWIENVWLLTGVPDSVTPRTLWDEIIAMDGMNGISGVVIQEGFAPVFWGGNQPESWEWMKSYWGRADFPKKPPERIAGRL